MDFLFQSAILLGLICVTFLTNQMQSETNRF